jgi:16S rRNA (uracil1498-N3)-methyltransferase
MPKFFVNQENIKDKEIIITSEDVNHIKNVLRKNLNDTLEICNAQNGENFLCEIVEIKKEQIICNILQCLKNMSEPKTYVHIYQGLPKSDKMELIIQKSVELGVAEITPTNMTRCIVKLDSKDERKKVERWQKISEVAAKQSGRDIIPKINNISNLSKIINECQEYDAIFLAYENEKENKLKNEIIELKKKQKEKYKIAVIIGPEGGLAAEEVEKAKQNGIKIITLGNRILRTETVALNILSILMYELE